MPQRRQQPSGLLFSGCCGVRARRPTAPHHAAPVVVGRPRVWASAAGRQALATRGDGWRSGRCGAARPAGAARSARQRRSGGACAHQSVFLAKRWCVRTLDADEQAVLAQAFSIVTRNLYLFVFNVGIIGMTSDHSPLGNQGAPPWANPLSSGTLGAARFARPPRQTTAVRARRVLDSHAR